MTQLITYQDVLTGTTMEQNVKASHLDIHIDNATILYIRKFLGTAQFEDLMNKVELSGVTGLTSYTATLYDYIKPMLVNYTLYTALPWLPTRISEKGINYTTSENTKNVDETRLLAMRTESLNIAEEYAQRALVYLRNNKDNYPLWREDIYQCELNNHASNSTFFSGIEFDSPNWKNELVYINGQYYRRGDLLS